MLADVSFQNMALKDVIEKSCKAILEKAVSRVCNVQLGLGYDTFLYQSCTYYYQPKLMDDSEIIDAFSMLAQKHTTYGFRKLSKRSILSGYK